MIFILLLLLLSSIFIHIQSKLITYSLLQTDQTCEENWKGSICFPTFSFNETETIQLDLGKENPCPSETLVYIRTRQCIYCATDLQDIHCEHRRRRRMNPTKKEHFHRNSIAIIGISLLAMLVIGSLFTLLLIKRSQAHTNLLELVHPNTNIRSINHIEVPRNIKSASIKSAQLTVPKTLHPPK